MSPYTHTQGDEPGDELPTPTQSTPEERAEALELRNAWLEARIQQLASLFGVPDGGQYLNDWRERAAALLTQQSQERAAIEKLGVKDPVLALQALRLDYEDLQAELDRAVGRLRACEEALGKIVRFEAISKYGSIYSAPGEFAAIARAALNTEEPADG